MSKYIVNKHCATSYRIEFDTNIHFLIDKEDYERFSELNFNCSIQGDSHFIYVLLKGKQHRLQRLILSADSNEEIRFLSSDRYDLRKANMIKRPKKSRKNEATIMTTNDPSTLNSNLPLLDSKALPDNYPSISSEKTNWHLTYDYIANESFLLKILPNNNQIFKLESITTEASYKELANLFTSNSISGFSFTADLINNKTLLLNYQTNPANVHFLNFLVSSNDCALLNRTLTV